jgi:hypothetical protein
MKRFVFNFEVVFDMEAIELFQSCLQQNRDQADVWASVGELSLGC